jgi:preprotein translocase subunit YajC
MMNDPTLSMFLPLILMLAIFYFLVWRPQSQRTKQLRESINTLKRGDTVITAGGHIATVSKAVKPEDEHVTVEIADGVHTRVIKSTLTQVRAKGSDKGDAAADKG